MKLYPEFPPRPPKFKVSLDTGNRRSQYATKLKPLLLYPFPIFEGEEQHAVPIGSSAWSVQKPKRSVLSRPLGASASAAELKDELLQFLAEKQEESQSVVSKDTVPPVARSAQLTQSVPNMEAWKDVASQNSTLTKEWQDFATQNPELKEGWTNFASKQQPKGMEDYRETWKEFASQNPKLKDKVKEFASHSVLCKEGCQEFTCSQKLTETKSENASPDPKDPNPPRSAPFPPPVVPGNRMHGSQGVPNLHSGGDIHVPNMLSGAPPQPTDSHRMALGAPRLSSRPSTQSSGRFGLLSHNSFFTRHNPHPGRVRHIKGLNDVPICAVQDDGFFPDARYKLNFPPQNHADGVFKTQWDRIPVNAININSQKAPINTVTGLQYFTGLQNYPYKEKAVPRMGMVPVTERWRDELRTLTEAAGLLPKQEQAPAPRPMYSPDTGRLVPPSSQSMIRGQSRRGKNLRQFMHISQEQDMENNVLQMLCQILQTEDVNSVQAWLISAKDQERSYVLELIKSAVTSREEYYRRQAQQGELQRPSSLPQGPGGPAAMAMPEMMGASESCNDIVKKIDRLDLEGIAPRPEGQAADPSKYTRYAYSDVKAAPNPQEQIKKDMQAVAAPAVRPPTSDAFKKAPTPLAGEAPKPPPTPSMRYTKTPIPVQPQAEIPVA